jgi:Phosphotransferase enzyme family
MSATTVQVPDSLEELLTPAWLTRALSTRFPAVHVTAVTRGPVVERLSTNARFRIECTPDVPEGLSPTLCVKGYFSEQGWSSRQAGEPEASFYRDLADDTGVRTLPSVWADVHPETRHGVVITEDVIEAGGVFRDALSPCSVEQTAALLGELARLHGYAWEDAETTAAPWLVPRVGQTLQVRGIKEIRQNFEGPLGVRVPDDVHEPQQLVDALRALAARTRGAGWTVIHGDTHVGNTFLDGEARPGLVDWQLVQHGHWSLDVAYHVASALEPAERARAERDLLRHYLDRLGSEGVSPPSFDTAWDDYRRSMPYGFFLWGITLFVTQDIIGELLYRLGTAVSDLQSYEALFAL